MTKYVPGIAEEDEVLNGSKGGGGVLSGDQVIIDDDVVAIRLPI